MICHRNSSERESSRLLSQQGPTLSLDFLKCKVMLNDRANFTDAMRRARSSRDVPGGSISVRGQTGQPVTARGFMVTEYTVSVDAESHHAPAEPYDGEYCPQGRHVPPEAEFETRRPFDALAMTQVRAQIAHDLTLHDHVPEFGQSDMPGKRNNLALHTYMCDVWTRSGGGQPNVRWVRCDRSRGDHRPEGLDSIPSRMPTPQQVQSRLVACLRDARGSTDPTRPRPGGEQQHSMVAVRSNTP